MTYNRSSRSLLTTESELMDACIRLLARRDYSAGELRKKLLAKTTEPHLVDSVIQRVQDLGYQNDERYAGAYVRYAISQGKGPGWIAAQLFQREIPKTLIDDSIDAAEVDWQSLAAEQLKRKFKAPALDQRELAKQFRYLTSRGYQPDVIRNAVDALKAEAVL